MDIGDYGYNTFAHEFLLVHEKKNKKQKTKQNKTKNKKTQTQNRQSEHYIK